MKTFLRYLVALLAVPVVGGGVGTRAQAPCNLSVTGDFESQCIVTTEKDEYYDEMPECIVACQGMTVTYRATYNEALLTAENLVWAVSGATWTAQVTPDVVTVEWGYGATGQIILTADCPDGTTCTLTLNVRLVAPPVAAASTTPAYVDEGNGEKVIHVCKGETVSFSDCSASGSSDMAGYYWSSSLGGTSASRSYTISQVWEDGEVVHRVYNNCGCYDEEVYHIRVLEGKPLELDCYGAVCQDAVVTYRALNPPCDQYMWHVDGGTIVGGQGTEKVTVQWDDPHDGYGVVSLDGHLCGQDACSGLFSRRIPVIQDHLVPEGQDTACVGEAVVYELPLFGSTEYTWTVTPATGVTVYGGDGDSRRTLVFDQPGEYRVSAVYRCDFLECGPFESGTRTVTVMPRLAVTGRDRVCVTSAAQFATSPAVPADWTVYSIDGGDFPVAQVASQPTLSFAFPQAGKYRVVARSGAYCEPAVFAVSVVDAPPAPTVAQMGDNPREACPYGSIGLGAASGNPDLSFVWVPECAGVAPGMVSGDEVSFTYNGTVCDIDVYTYDKVLGCLSVDPLVHHVDELALAEPSIPQQSDACPGTVISWQGGEVPYQEGVLYTWTVREDKQYCASVQGSALENGIDLTVHELGAYPDDFYMKLKREYCGLVRYDTFYIHINDQTPVPITLTASQTDICPGEGVTFTAAGGEGDSYQWTVDGEVQPFVGNPFSRTFLTSGSHSVCAVYSATDNCTNSLYQTTECVGITVHPAPVIYKLQYDHTANTLSVVTNGTVVGWRLDGQDIPGETGATIAATYGTGTYTCVVTSGGAHPCEVSAGRYVGPATAGTMCEESPFTRVDSSFCDAWLTLRTSIHYSSDVSWNVQGGQHTIGDYQSNRHRATVHFLDVGEYLITASSSGEDCEISTCRKTVGFIPGFSVEKRCDKIIVHNDSKSLYGDATVRVFVNGADKGTFPFAAREYAVDISANGTYSIEYQVTAGGQTYTCPGETVLFTTVSSAVVTVTSENTLNPAYTCNNTPIRLTASVTPPMAVNATTWTFGDGSSFTMSGNSICHTFAEYDTYSVTATINDANGCPVQSDAVAIKSAPKDFISFITKQGPDVCLGLSRMLVYGASGDHFPSLFWWDNGPLSNSNFTYVTSPGNHAVVVANTSFCHDQAQVNVAFLNTPTAEVTTDKAEYCQGERVTMYGATGPDSVNCSYEWVVTNQEAGFLLTLATATASFVADIPGSYHVSLCVTDNGSQCSSCGVADIKVHETPAAPDLGYGSRQCLDDPPVELVGTPYDLHWSNGSSGASALYFTPGVATAWYVDPSTGCKSREGSIVIDAVPDFDALLTGCYEKCDRFFEDGHSLPVWGLTSGEQIIQWEWLFSGGSINQGSGNYTHSPLILPLQGFGSYRLVADYNGGNCGVKSPTLTLQPKKRCDCEGLDVSYNMGYYVKDCRVYYNIKVKVCNNGRTRACVKSLRPLFDEDWIRVQSPFSPFELRQGDCYSFPLVLEVEQFDPSTTASFQLYDECNNCTTDFSLDLMPGSIECTMPMRPLNWSVNGELSGSSAAYLVFALDLSSAYSLLAFWTEPPMVVDYLFDGTSLVEGLAMIDIGTLSQLLAADSVFCFHAITCVKDQLCKREYCLTREMLLDWFYRTNGGLIDEPPHGANADSSAVQAKGSAKRTGGEPTLAPNPTTGEVTVETGAPIPGSAAGEVEEVLVMDAYGRRLATFSHTATFNVAHLPSGTYIVRVVTSQPDKPDTTRSEERVSYLKLVKM